MLTLANELAASINRHNNIYILCGKIDYCQNGERSSAYIIKETEMILTILKKDRKIDILCKNKLVHNVVNIIQDRKL